MCWCLGLGLITCVIYIVLKNICLVLAGIWQTHSVAGQTKILWQDPLNQGWKAKTPYRFFLKHRPLTGVINLQIYEGSVKIGEKIVLFTAFIRPYLSTQSDLCTRLLMTLLKCFVLEMLCSKTDIWTKVWLIRKIRLQILILKLSWHNDYQIFSFSQNLRYLSNFKY